MDKQLEIFGPYPPPIGGISLHIFRMEQILKREKIKYTIYNYSFQAGPNVIATNKSLVWYLKYLFQKKAALIHFHHFFTFQYFYFFLLSHFSKSNLIITIHGEDILKYNRIKANLIIWILKKTKMRSLIVVSQQLSNYLVGRGIKNLWLPAYVPPDRKNSVQLEKIADKEYFIYSIWKLQKSIAGKIYNIELAFRFLSHVQSEFHMLFLIGSELESDKIYLDYLLNLYSVRNSVTIVYEKQLVDYLPNCKFLLRTNNEDGYGVSLQEALDLRVPAIATDVCVRPKGTILFKKGDLTDLLMKVKNIKDLWDESSVETPLYHEELVNLYKENLYQP